MTTLYDLHSKPKELYGYEDAPYRIPELAYELAERNSEVRNPRLEAAIMRDPRYAYRYARYVLKQRWPAAESYIMQWPISAYLYALYVLKQRWPEAESVIMQNSHMWVAYKQHFKIK
jgi:hypothetical protein